MASHSLQPIPQLPSIVVTWCQRCLLAFRAPHDECRRGVYALASEPNHLATRLLGPPSLHVGNLIINRTGSANPDSSSQVIVSVGAPWNATAPRAHGLMGGAYHLPSFPRTKTPPARHENIAFFRAGVIVRAYSHRTRSVDSGLGRRTLPTSHQSGVLWQPRSVPIARSKLRIIDS